MIDNTVQYSLWSLDSGTHIKSDRTIIPIQKCIVIKFYFITYIKETLLIFGSKKLNIGKVFQFVSRFTTVPVIYGEGGIAAAMGSTMPTTANSTAQGMISVISFAVSVFIFAYILKRAKAQKKNPWKEEIFTDTRDYQEAMARAK